MPSSNMTDFPDLNVRCDNFAKLALNLISDTLLQLWRLLCAVIL